MKSNGLPCCKAAGIPSDNATQASICRCGSLCERLAATESRIRTATAGCNAFNSWSNRHGFAGDYCLAQSAAALYRPATRQNSKIIITGPSSLRAVLSTHKFVTLRYRDAVGTSDHCRQWFRKRLFIITSDSNGDLDPRHGQIPHRLPERFSFGR